MEPGRMVKTLAGRTHKQMIIPEVMRTPVIDKFNFIKSQKLNFKKFIIYV